MTAGDRVIERAADRLEEAAGRASSEGGLKARLTGELVEDAAFLRKLKPSLIAARIRGEEPPEDRAPSERPTSIRAPDTLAEQRPKAGLNPFVIAAGALAVGMLLAKVIDWRGHAHPRE